MSDQAEKMLQMQTILKKSLVTIKKLEAEVQDLKNNSSEPIAIIGMGTRMPGDVNSPEDLWQLLIKKEDTISEIPKDRWDGDAIYNEDPLVPGKSTSKHGAFLSNDVKTFDAGFFGITPREAKSIDPMQKMLLEVTQETLEKSGISPNSLRGSKTGVFLGLGNSDYMQARLRSGNLEDVDVYDATGIPFATAAGRLSYLFDLQGPSIAVDTACSSALVSLHMAADSLRNKESNVAIAGAASLMLTPELYIALTKLGSLANDGKCRAFDDNANGYIRGEGCGIVLLKRLSDAEADGDDILAVIKGSAVQHDGLSNGFTAPNPEVQINVIGEALKNAGVDPKTIGFVEAHGLGNRFTDALEIQAIQETYGNREKPIYIGSVKPNIGHMEAAIGMAMLAKVIGSLQHQQIAPNINFETPNKDVDWDAIKVKVPTEVIDWQPTQDKPLRAAINLSGYSGTNVHMIFEAYSPKENETIDKIQPAQNFSISAKSKAALDQQIDNYITLLTENPSIDYNGLLYTLSVGRSSYDYKLSAQFENTQELLEGLTAFKAEGKHKSISINDVELARNKEVAMLFTGQGAQYNGMCHDLYRTNSVFRNALDKCNEILNQYLDKPIIDVLYGEDTEIIHQTIYSQPALFVVEYALSELWKSWGIEPAAVVGHSVGEFVALTVGGVLSLEDALLMIAKRGQLMQSLPLNEGGMVAVLAEESVVEPYLKDFENVNIAAVNSPKALTISGHKDEVGQVLANLKENKVKAIGLTVSHAFHSYLMEPILADFEKVAQSVKLNAPQIPVISNVTGKELMLSDLGPKYFSDHIRGTVQYWNDVKYLDETLGIDIFLEAGPNPTLIGLAKKGIKKETALWLGSTKKNINNWKTIYGSLKELYLADVSINWKNVYKEVDAKSIELPTYPWQRKEYWYNPVRGMSTSNANVVTQTKETQEEISAIQGPIVVSKDNLMEIMQREAARIMGLEKGSQLDIYKSVREQGFDSMMAGQFLARIEKYLGTKLEMSLIHVYNDLNSLYNYIVKEVLGDNESTTVSMADVMFDANGKNMLEEESGDWHDIKESDGVLMRWFKKFDKRLGVNDK